MESSGYHTNKYSADSACEHCGGVVRHEKWCITENGLVKYAYEVVLDASKLTEKDKMILHALGVCWVDIKQCDGTCSS